MPFIPDKQEKTVKIPIQVRNGRIQFYFDGPLPLLEEGVIGLDIEVAVTKKQSNDISRKRRWACSKKQSKAFILSWRRSDTKTIA